MDGSDIVIVEIILSLELLYFVVKLFLKIHNSLVLKDNSAN
jgi:hypothetical protein